MRERIQSEQSADPMVTVRTPVKHRTERLHLSELADRLEKLAKRGLRAEAEYDDGSWAGSVWRNPAYPRDGLSWSCDKPQPDPRCSPAIEREGPSMCDPLNDPSSALQSGEGGK
jgi:hypothetical protein